MSAPTAAKQNTGRAPNAAAESQAGGAVATFAGYLATRPDLLPMSVRAQLGRVAPACVPMSWAALRATVRGAIGCDIDDAFMVLEVTPLAIGWCSEVHRARLRDGTPALVTFANTLAANRLKRECERLAPTREQLKLAIGPDALRNAIEDFTAALARQRDLSTIAAAHRAWARAHIDGVAVPTVFERLSGPTMLTTDAIGVLPLQAADDLVRPDVACRLCTVWVQGAIAGLPFATDVDIDRIRLTETGSIVWNATSVSTLAPQERMGLWEYLVAVATGDVDTACSKLLAYTVGTGAEDQLRHEFRQIVPFRDGPWGDAKSTLAEQLLMQWARASAAGRLPSGGFPSVYRGLYAVCMAARDLDPRRDHLRDAIGAVRILNALQSIRGLVTGENIEDVLDRYARASLEVPRKFDTVLTLASGGGSPGSVSGPGADTRSVRDRIVVLIASVALFVSITLILPRISSDLVRMPGVRQLLLVSYVLAGLLLIIALGLRPRSLRRHRG